MIALSNPNLDRSIDEIGLPKRVVTFLTHLGHATVRDLLQTSAEELLQTPGIGMVSVREIRRKLESLGLDLPLGT